MVMLILLTNLVIFNGCVKHVVFALWLKIKIMGELSRAREMVFMYFHVASFLKVQNCVIKKKRFKDLDDLLISFTLLL
jgi:hypothetical protein